MKQVSEKTMRSVNGGYWYCKVCRSTFLTKGGAMWHTIISGHAFQNK